MIFWLAELQTATDLTATESLLTPEEALVFARLRGERRRAEWLLGRSLGKQLVQRHCEACDLEVPDRRAIGILPDASGAPVVHIDGTPQSLAMSISHSHAAGFVALTPVPGLRIGVDIERVAPRDEAFLRDFFTAAEQNAVRQAEPDDRIVLATAIWCGKEAYYKAIGTGLPLRTGALEMVPIAPSREDWTPFTIHRSAEGAWEASWRKWGDYLLSVVTG